MRLATRTSTLAVCVTLALAACSSSPDPSPSAPAESPPATDDPATPSPPETEEPAETEEPEGSGPDAASGVPDDALLPASAWEAAEGDGEDSDGVAAWRLPDLCGAGEPAGATAMRTVTQGDGAEESPVGVQQVALFADADTAATEAGRLADALDACAANVEGESTYVAEPVDVGAEGTGLATDYYGASADGDLDEALGSYLATTRRGTAVTLVALDGGESTVGAARDTVTAQAQAAWELLCAYDEEGC